LKKYNYVVGGQVPLGRLCLPSIPAYPSQRDVKIAYYPEASQVIISLADFNKPDVRSFKIDNSKISEEELKISQWLIVYSL